MYKGGDYEPHPFGDGKFASPTNWFAVAAILGERSILCFAAAFRGQQKVDLSPRIVATHSCSWRLQTFHRRKGGMCVHGLACILAS